MRDISEIDREFDKFVSSLKGKLVEAQQHATEFMLEDAKENIEIPEEARNTAQFVAYANSIKMKNAEVKDNEIKSSVYSDLLVGGASKWAEVPVGAFLEWGTGPLGEESNLYEHGYPYTTLEPWDFHTWLQLQQTGNWGIIARPHMWPAFIRAHNILRQNVQEAVEGSWTE